MQVHLIQMFASTKLYRIIWEHQWSTTIVIELMMISRDGPWRPRNQRIRDLYVLLASLQVEVEIQVNGDVVMTR